MLSLVRSCLSDIFLLESECNKILPFTRARTAVNQIDFINLFKYYKENKYMISKRGCQHGMACSIQDCKYECHLRDNTPETP
jgi:hypothetical protein